MSLHVPGFGGGVALLGGADTRSVDELLVADGLDIGARGALVASADVTDYVALQGVGASTDALSRVYALLPLSGANYSDTLAVGEGVSATGQPAYVLTVFPREGQVSPLHANGGALTGPALTNAIGAVLSPLAAGVVVTGAVAQGAQPFAESISDTLHRVNAFMLNVGAREGTPPNLAPGLYAVMVLTWQPDGFPPGQSSFFAYPIQKFDALGTGPLGTLLTGVPVEDPGGIAYGSKSQQLYFRGIVGFNNYVFGWGFDSADVNVLGQGNRDGPCRVMFSNPGRPFTFGNDNQSTTVPPSTPKGDRLFTDSDAIILGTAGEIIRAACVVFGKLFFATNRGLHFIQGYGRDTFLTNGATPVMNAYNCIGPHALLEGPDRLLYGVGDRGLWRYNGASLPEPLGEKLIDFAGRSTGWWDGIWTDASRGAGMPGQTNADLVWTAVDWTRQQVLVGIPWCNATSGRGVGSDTIVIRYHIRTGGFTRQVFRGVQYTCAGYFRRDNQAPEARFLGTATPGAVSVQRYGDIASPALPTEPMVAEFGPYAPFGPDGDGVVTRVYLTLAWETPRALPLVFRVDASIDDAAVLACRLTIAPDAPATPSDGDVWLDTSERDLGLGNGRAGVGVVAARGYLARTRLRGAWSLIPGQGGAGVRATVPIPLPRRPGARVTLRLTCEAAAGRFELEGLGIHPGDGNDDA